MPKYRRRTDTITLTDDIARRGIPLATQNRQPECNENCPVLTLF